MARKILVINDLVEFGLINPYMPHWIVPAISLTVGAVENMRSVEQVEIAWYPQTKNAENEVKRFEGKKDWFAEHEQLGRVGKIMTFSSKSGLIEHQIKNNLHRISLAHLARNYLVGVRSYVMDENIFEELQLPEVVQVGADTLNTVDVWIDIREDSEKEKFGILPGVVEHADYFSISFWEDIKRVLKMHKGKRIGIYCQNARRTSIVRKAVALAAGRKIYELDGGVNKLKDTGFEFQAYKDVC